MVRLATVVVAGVAHHVTQRGNRRQETFFQEEDYLAYLETGGRNYTFHIMDCVIDGAPV